MVDRTKYDIKYNTSIFSAIGDKAISDDLN
jgi:hypothetical protein